ncbi:hypothetical protein [Escherichia sp. 93.0750]|uniref:hypothetical protein n=1 Tax=unclassified Escherichia TaxID=2608889 RepID=UPI001300042D|nr:MULTISPECIES: hypothetical protein [unclassified Escherichia]
MMNITTYNVVYCGGRSQNFAQDRVVAGVNDYRIEIKMKLFLQAGGKKGIETNTPSGDPEGVRQLNRH